MIELTEYEAAILRRFLHVDYIEYTDLTEQELAICQHLRRDRGLLGGDFTRFCRNGNTLVALMHYENLHKDGNGNERNQSESASKQSLHPIADDSADHSQALKKSAVDFVVSFFPTPVGKGLNLIQKAVKFFRNRSRGRLLH